MEHRWGQRVPAAIGVRLACRPYAIGVGRIRDASMSGAFVSTDLELPLLARVRIEIDVELWDGRTQTRKLLAHVVRRDATGIGVEWCALSPAGLEELLPRASRSEPASDLRLAGPVIRRSAPDDQDRASYQSGL